MNRPTQMALLGATSSGGLQMTQATKDRIEGRKSAECIFAEYIEGESDDWIAGFARACQAFAESALPRQSSGCEPMTAVEAKRYEEVQFPYGKHKGELIGSVPMAYLNWIADQNRQLIKYVDSQRGLDRTAREDE